MKCWILKRIMRHCIWALTVRPLISSVFLSRGTALMQCEWQKVISRWLEYDLKRECGSSTGYNCSFPDHPERPSARLGDLTSVGMLLMILWELIHQFANKCQTFFFPNSNVLQRPPCSLQLVGLILRERGGGISTVFRSRVSQVAPCGLFLPREGISKRGMSELAAVSFHMVFQIAAIFSLVV